MPARQEFQKILQKTLKGRAGLVLIGKPSQSSMEVFGDKRLLDEKFMIGSLAKLWVAQTALATNPVSIPDFRCTGHLTLHGKRYFCWNYRGHGFLNFEEALSVSCNLYFIQLADSLGSKTLFKSFQGDSSFLQSHPIDSRTASLFEKEFLSFAIGQARFFQVSIREVFEFWKRLVIRLAAPELRRLSAGLERVATHGTAKQLRFIAESRRLISKTGTADSLQSAYLSNGWFLGAFPKENPQIVFLIFLKDAHGYREPVRLARQLMTLLF